MTEAFIFDAVRTPRGKGKKDGALHSVKPVNLIAGLLRALAERNDLDTSQVDDIVLGCVTPVGDQGADIAKTAALVADWDESVSGQQINRFCASGLEAVNLAPSPAEAEIAARARTLATDLLAPRAIERDRHERFPVEELRELARARLLGVNIPAALGGAEAGALGYALATRRLGWPELRWVAYALVALGGAKLVLQDLPAGRPSTLVPSLALYGVALLLAPRLLRPGRGAAS